MEKGKHYNSTTYIYQRSIFKVDILGKDYGSGPVYLCICVNQATEEFATPVGN